MVVYWAEVPFPADKIIIPINAGLIRNGPLLDSLTLDCVLAGSEAKASKSKSRKQCLPPHCQ